MFEFWQLEYAKWSNKMSGHVASLQVSQPWLELEQGQAGPLQEIRELTNQHTRLGNQTSQQACSEPSKCLYGRARTLFTLV